MHALREYDGESVIENVLHKILGKNLVLVKLSAG